MKFFLTYIVPPVAIVYIVCLGVKAVTYIVPAIALALA